MNVKFGFGLPTGAEGLMYPVPYASVSQIVELGELAERLGFDSVWGNDHLSTPAYVRRTFAEPPRLYDPFAVLSFLAARTSTVSLATAITVMSFRHPVLLAKQIATLDELSAGRVLLGAGIGAYADESAVLWPQGIHRGRHAEEYLEVLGKLLGAQRRLTHHGEYLHFDDVESFPRPARRVPILSAGNASGSRQRAARHADGWLPAGLLPDELCRGMSEVRDIAERTGRQLPADFELAPQFTVHLGRTSQEALTSFEATQLRRHDVSLADSTLKHQQDDWRQRDLIGSPAEVLDRVGRYVEAGVTTFAGLLFAADDVAATVEQMSWFATEVLGPWRTGATNDSRA